MIEGKNGLRKTRMVKAGGHIFGGGYPVLVQTMWKKPLDENLEAVAGELERLKTLGCDLCRFSVPDLEQAEKFNALCALTDMPLVADIHFDYRLALKCLEGRPAKIRINPGNIGAAWKVKEVVSAAAGNGAAIRVGINGGSLPSALRKEADRAQAMVKAAAGELELLESLNFKDVVFSLKSSDPEETVRANEEFAAISDCPLHLGVTEAGSLIPGVVKSAVAFFRLLSKGIGDTIRVSLSDIPEKEIIAGREILRAAGLQKKGTAVVSCPRCGRCSFDPDYAFLEKTEAYCAGLDKTRTIAVMGCVVNGPEEAKHADLGITGAGKEIVIYKDSRILRKVRPEEAWQVFRGEIDKL